jgi:hypothetical protein
MGFPGRVFDAFVSNDLQEATATEEEGTSLLELNYSHSMRILRCKQRSQYQQHKSNSALNLGQSIKCRKRK